MKIYETASIRNVAIVGHGGSGKTSLTSAILYDSGAVNRLGRVEDGNTVTDFDPDEIARQISLSTALAYCDWNKIKLNILDTPGFGNFIQEAHSALQVADTALVNVCGVAVVEVQTEKVWQFSAEFGLPRMIVVKKDSGVLVLALQGLDHRFPAFGCGMGLAHGDAVIGGPGGNAQA